MNDAVISCRNLVKQFSQGDLAVPVLNGVNLDLVKGEMLAIVGASGSGKSTLLHILGGLDAPTSGNIRILGQDIAQINEEERCGFDLRDGKSNMIGACKSRYPCHAKPPMLTGFMPAPVRAGRQDLPA